MLPQASASVPITGMRKMIARKMMESLSGSAQLSFFTRVDASHLVATRAGWKDAGVPAGYEDLLLCALRDTLVEHPGLNGVVTGETVQLYDEIRISVAVALPGGLVAPSLPDLRGLSLAEVVAARRSLVQRALAGKLTVAEMSFGTFTISNLGLTCVDHFTPILNGGQLGILGIGRIAPEVAVDTAGEIVARPEISLSLTNDHRVIDGATSGDFLTALSDRIRGALPQV